MSATPRPWGTASSDDELAALLGEPLQETSGWFSLRSADESMIGSTYGRDREGNRANADLIVRAVNHFDELVEALEALEQFFERPGEGSSERFDRLAMQYHHETGNAPPGKSWPPEIDRETTQEKRERYDAWFAGKVATARAALSRAKGEPA